MDSFISVEKKAYDVFALPPDKVLRVTLHLLLLLGKPYQRHLYRHSAQPFGVQR